MLFIKRSTTTLMRNCAILIFPNKNRKMNNKNCQTSNNQSILVKDQKIDTFSSHTLTDKKKCDEKISMYLNQKNQLKKKSVRII